MACYVSQIFLLRFSVLPFLPQDAVDLMALYIFTPQGYFGSFLTQFRIGNAYAHHLGPLHRSVFPEIAFPDYNFPYLVAGDFNIRNPAAGPFKILSPVEEKESVPDFTPASDRGFYLLNTPGRYNRFPSTSTHWPSAINLSFANPYSFPAFRSWDATPLPSTGSDHVPILLTLILAPPGSQSDAPSTR